MGVKLVDGTVAFEGCVLECSNEYTYLGDGDGYDWDKVIVWYEGDAHVLRFRNDNVMPVGTITMGAWPTLHGAVERSHTDDPYRRSVRYQVTVDATPDVAAAHAALQARRVEEARVAAQARAVSDRDATRRDVRALLRTDFTPAVKVVSTRSKAAVGTVGLAFFAKTGSFSGHASTAIGVATTNRSVAAPDYRDARGVMRPSKFKRWADVEWCAPSTLEVLGGESDEALCWAAAAMLAGYDPEDALQVLASIHERGDGAGLKSLPALNLRSYNDGQHYSVDWNAEVRNAWVQAVEGVMHGMAKLDNAARSADHKATIAAEKAAAKAKLAAEKKAAKAAARASRKAAKV